MDAATELLAARIAQLKEDLAERRDKNRELEARLSEGREREKVVHETIKELQSLLDALAGNGEAEDAADTAHVVERQRPSQAIRTLLEDHSDGLTVGDCVRLLRGRIHSQATNKRNTISTTLYNMKKRGEVVHDPRTGRYSLLTVGIPEE